MSGSSKASPANEPDPPAVTEAEPDDEPTFWETIRDHYFALDRRTLGLTRILLGVFLIFDLFRRTTAWWQMFANDGVLPTHVNLWRPQSGGFSFFNAFSSREELWALWLLGLCIYVCLLVGYKTKVAQVLAAVFVASMNGRVLLIENGGYVVHNLLMLWTAFLPLGDRFSVDALLDSYKRSPERTQADLNDRSTIVAPFRLRPHVTFVSAVILLQICAIYFFNVVHKTGPAWRDGTAVHYVLYVDRMVNPLIGATREHLPNFVLLFLGKSVMFMEAALPICVLSPLARTWSKRFAILFMNLLHIGFGSTFVLGPFAWALCVFSVLLFSPDDWEAAYRTMRRTHRARLVRYDPTSRSAFAVCRLLKRLDRFELLTFEQAPGVGWLEVRAPEGRARGASRPSRMGSLAEAVAALPAGPVLALPMRLPGIRHAGDLLLGWGLGEVTDERALPQHSGTTVHAEDERPPLGADDLKGQLRADHGSVGRGVARMVVSGVFVVAGAWLLIYDGSLYQWFDTTGAAAVPFHHLVVSAGGVGLGLGGYLLSGPALRVPDDDAWPRYRGWLIAALVLLLAATLPTVVPAMAIKWTRLARSTKAELAQFTTSSAAALIVQVCLVASVASFVRCFLHRPSAVELRAAAGRMAAGAVLLGAGVAGVFALEKLAELAGVHPATPPSDALTWVRLTTWTGGLTLVVAAVVLVRPLFRLNLATPAPVRLKALRGVWALREVLTVLFFVAAVNQALVELWVFRPLKLPQPSPIRELAHKLRYLQGWFMFSPNPVMDDGTIVVDAITVDGRHIDPFMEAPPNFDLLNAKSFGYDQIWSDYFNRMHLPGNTAYRNAMKDYMYRLPERTGNPNDAIVSGDVYWVKDMNPRWNTRKSYDEQREKLFSFHNPDPEVRRRHRELTVGERASAPVDGS